MTQEELDALMNGDIDDIEESATSVDDNDMTEDLEEEDDSDIPEGFHIDSGELPFPATNENKMVHQLDDVTKESEEKATQIFDIIENISSELMEKEENATKIIEVLTANLELFTKLNAKFPDIEAFQTSLEETQTALDDANDLMDTLQNSGGEIMNVMDIMQYQDIHRQKIERVINVMRALSKYMNKLFEGKVDDEKRVSSAKHIVGDTNNDLASTDDIEALLEQFAGSK
jgi:ABC-type transporter Mla subunit MlaD